MKKRRMTVMMLLLKILAVIAICAFMVGVARILSNFDLKLDRFVSAYNTNVDAINKKFANTFNRLAQIEENQSLEKTRRFNADDQIEEIISRLEKITEDIARIDRDEKEIRSYYVNYREPVPVSTGGVAWANEFVCGDDNNE
jgi:biopolymer transport protein ExbB/TolQ